MTLPALLITLGFGAFMSACSSKKEEETVQKHICQQPEVFSKYQKPPGTRYVPLYLHRFVDGEGINGHTRFNIEAAMKKLNEAYQPLNLHFYAAAFEDHNMPEVLYSTSPEQLDPRNLWKTLYPTPEKASANALIRGAIHVFMVDNIYQAGGEGLPDRGFVVAKSSMPFYGDVWVHEMGHVFGLLHPHDRVNHREKADNSECREEGDFLCDTAPGSSFIGGRQQFFS